VKSSLVSPEEGLTGERLKQWIVQKEEDGTRTTFTGWWIDTGQFVREINGSGHIGFSPGSGD
jgi:hypothetical protein